MVTQKKGKVPKFNKDVKWQWLEDAMAHEHQGFTFPQVKPSLLLLETPASLDRKVPMVPGPKDVVILSTTKLGTKRYQVPPDAEFDLTDPQRAICEYNFLHDPNLKEYLNHPLVRKTLTDKGLVTKDGYVKCTIKEFNDYRQWIRKLKLNAIDQDFHRISAINNKNNSKDYKNNEALLVTKKRQERAKELYEKKLKKKEQDRERYIKYLEEQDERVESIKRENERYYKARKRQRQKERDHMKKKNEENENKGRRIRFKILINSKKNIEQHKENALKLQRDKIMEKEKRAEELWKRRQSYCLEKMQDEKVKKENAERERRQSILKRENVYERERRKSDAYMLQHTKENRENALKHMEEATEFLERIEAKKEAEIQKWREKLKCIKERERLLTYYREKRLHDKQSGKLRRRHSKSRKSIWDVDQVLLKEIMCHMTEKERQELEDFHNELNEDIKKEYSKEVIKEEETGEEIEADEETSLKLVASEHDVISNDAHNQRYDVIDDKENGLTGNHRSFIVFGNIEKDDIEEVYHEDIHDVEIGDDHHILHVPGLVIEHTKSCHEHLPCVDDDADFHEIETHREELVQTLHEVKEDEKIEVTSVSSYSSYEILVIPSAHEIEANESCESTDATFIHVIDDQPVLLSSGSIMKLSSRSSVVADEEIIDTAKAIVLASLTSAAKDLGYSDTEIEKELGRTDEKRSSPSIADVSESPSQQIASYAKEITQISLIGAAVTLGYPPEEIADALGLEKDDNGLYDIVNSYEMSIQGMAKAAIVNAAISLGYTENEANEAMSNLMDERISPCSQQSIGVESKKSSISLLATELAKNAITNAARKLGLTFEASEQLGEVCTSRTEINQLSFLSIDQTNSIDEPYVVLAHNALRGAALALGYEEEEVVRVIGSEKFFDEEDKLRQWAYSITQDALHRGKISYIEQELRNVPCESVNTKCENYLRSYMPFTPPNSSNAMSTDHFLDSRYTTTYNNSAPVGKRNSAAYSDEEIEQVSSDLALTAIKNAAMHMGYSEEEINIALNESDKEEKKYNVDDIDESELKQKARDFVDDILGRAVEICKKEKINEKSLEDNAKYKKAALKFTMVVLGSALQSLGYTENQILRAINDDTKRRTGDKFKEVHPNIAVQFNEASIFRARRESLSISDKQGRRQSIKERPSTPKPSKEEMLEIEGSKPEENLLSEQPVQKKMRRPTPYMDANFQQQVIKAYEMEKKMQSEIIEEDEDEEEEEEEDSAQWKSSFSISNEKTSNSLLKPMGSLHRDFSNFKESDIMCQIKEETRHDASVLDVLSEYPTEREFLTFAKKQEQLEIHSQFTDHEKSLMNLLGHEQLAPEILDLYNAIQTDILRLLTSTNSRLLSFHSNPSPITYSPDITGLSKINKTPLHAERKQNQSPVIIEEMYRDSSPLVIQADSPNTKSYQKLPNIPSRNNSFATFQRKSSTGLLKQGSGSSSNDFYLKSMPSLPNSQSSSLSKLKLVTSKSSSSGSLPSIRNSSSILLANQNLSHKTLTNEEFEVVLKAPADFNEDLPLSSNDRFQSRDSFKEQSKDEVSHEPCVKNRKMDTVPSYRNISPTPPKTTRKKDRKSRTDIIEKYSSKKIIQYGEFTKSSSEIVPSYARPLKRDSTKTDETIRPKKSPRKTSQSDTEAVFERLSSTRKQPITPSKEDVNKSQDSSSVISTPHPSVTTAQSKSKSFERRSSSYKVLAEKLSKAPLKSSIVLSPVPESPLKPPSNSSQHRNERQSVRSINELSPLVDKSTKSHFSLVNVPEKTSKTASKVVSQKLSKIEKISKNQNELTQNAISKSSYSMSKEKSSKTSMKAPSNDVMMKASTESSAKSDNLKSTISKSNSLSKHRPKSSISKAPSKLESNEKYLRNSQSQQNVSAKKKLVKPKRRSKKSVSKIDIEVGEKTGNETKVDSPPKQNTDEKNHVEIFESTSPVPIEKSISVTFKNGSQSNNPNSDIQSSKNEANKESPKKTTPNEVKESSTTTTINKLSSRKSMIRPSVSRNLEKSSSKFPNIASVTTLSFDIEDKLKTGNKSYSQRLVNSDVADEEDLSNKIDTIANIRSSATFEPNPQKPNSTFILSTHSLKSLTTGQASKKSIFKTRSLGSAGKIMATDSRQRHHSSSLRESITMMPLNEQGDCTDFSNINSFIDNQKHQRQPSKINASSMMWVPSQSLAKECDVMVEPSPSALLVKSASVSRQLSASSFKSGHIFVTPAASINFAAPHSDKTLRETSAVSRASQTEIVEKQISGAFLSKQNSILSQQGEKDA